MTAARTEGVTITGIGMLTPVGRGIGEVFDAVCTGRSGLVSPPVGHPVAGSIEVAGLVAARDGDLDPSRVGSGPELNTLDRTIVLAILTARQALADAGVVVGRDVDPRRIGVILGGVGGLATLEQQVLQRSARGRVAVSPYLLTGVLPNMPSARIAIEHGIRGYSSSVGTACASGAQAIADAVRLIRCGELDMVLCGASEAPLFATFAETFGNARALARGWQAPADASRPFDRRRNGFVLSEGAALLLLERAGHASARGATGYADVVGYGTGTDAHHLTTPRADGSGAADCMSMAISRAGLEPADIGYLNAHGTSTKLGDLAETTAIGLAFGEHQPPVSSTKALTGHMLGTSGVVEAAISALAIASGLLPPTYNLDDPDPACALDHICKQPRPAAIHHALSNSFGFGGQNVSLLFGPSSLPPRELPEVTDVPVPVPATDHERGNSL